jgi:hypothetical protein
MNTDTNLDGVRQRYLHDLNKVMMAIANGKRFIITEGQQENGRIVKIIVFEDIKDQITYFVRYYKRYEYNDGIEGGVMGDHILITTVKPRLSQSLILEYEDVMPLLNAIEDVCGKSIIS